MRIIILFTTMILFLTIPISAIAVPPPPPPPGVTVTVPLPPPIIFAAPPEVIVLPEVEVYVVPSVPQQLFFYDGYWWRPWNARWYRSPYYDRSWGVYSGVPFWYNKIPYTWRENYRTHLWGGHPWNYHHIRYNDLQRNWRTWHNTHHWNKPEHRQVTHHYDGTPYGAAQTKPGTGHPGKVEKSATPATQGKPGKGGGSATEGKVGKVGHGTTGAKAYTSDKHTAGQTKGEHTRKTEGKK